MNTRKPLDAKATGLMFFLCMIWGMQQVVLKATGHDMPPMMQIGIRSGMAAVLVYALIRFRGGMINLRDGSWKPGLLAGLFFATEYIFVGQGLRYTTASHMTVFIYTAPIFAALGLQWRLPEERLKPVQWVGIAIAFLGIITTFSGHADNVQAAPNMLLGDLLGLAAGLSWGATTVLIRCSRLSLTPATTTTLYQLIGAFIILLPVSAVMRQSSFTITPAVLASLSYQVFIVSFASFLAWFWLLRNYLASRLGVLSFLTPLYGIIFGVVLLHEPLERNFVIGTVLVFAGILLVSGYEWILHKLKRL